LTLDNIYSPSCAIKHRILRKQVVISFKRYPYEFAALKKRDARGNCPASSPKYAADGHVVVRFDALYHFLSDDKNTTVQWTVWYNRVGRVIFLERPRFPVNTRLLRVLQTVYETRIVWGYWYSRRMFAVPKTSGTTTERMSNAHKPSSSSITVRSPDRIFPDRF